MSEDGQYAVKQMQLPRPTPRPSARGDSARTRSGGGRTNRTELSSLPSSRRGGPAVSSRGGASPSPSLNSTPRSHRVSAPQLSHRSGRSTARSTGRGGRVEDDGGGGGGGSARLSGFPREGGGGERRGLPPPSGGHRHLPSDHGHGHGHGQGHGGGHGGKGHHGLPEEQLNPNGTQVLGAEDRARLMDQRVHDRMHKVEDPTSVWAVPRRSVVAPLRSKYLDPHKKEKDFPAENLEELQMRRKSINKVGVRVGWMRFHSRRVCFLAQKRVLLSQPKRVRLICGGLC